MSPQMLIWTAVDEYRHTRGELHTPLYLLNFYPDKGEFCALNCAAEERIGYRIQPESLPLSPETRAAIRTLYRDYEQYRDPQNPYAKPTVPPEHRAAFNKRAEALYEKISAELGQDFQITKFSQWF